MKFEGPPQFNPEEVKPDTGKPGLDSAIEKYVTQEPKPTKSLEIDNSRRMKVENPPETKSERTVSPEKNADKIPEQNKPERESALREAELPRQETEAKRFAKVFREVYLHRMEQERSFIGDKEGISQITKTIRDALKKIDVETLENFAREIGIDCVLKTSLVASTGGGVTELTDGRKILLYYNLLPWQGRYTLAHEVGHIALGHLAAFDGPRTLKEGLKCEWDAERFASNLTRIPRPLAWASWGIDGLLSNIPRLFNRFRKSGEVKKIMQQLGSDSRTEHEINEILGFF